MIVGAFMDVSSCKSDISGVWREVFRVQPGPRMGLIQEETDGRRLWI